MPIFGIQPSVKFAPSSFIATSICILHLTSHDNDTITENYKSDRGTPKASSTFDSTVRLTKSVTTRQMDGQTDTGQKHL